MTEEGEEEPEELRELQRKLRHTAPRPPIAQLGMVAGRKPTSTWQTVAAKVALAKRGLGKDVRIDDFKIEELGGRAGKFIFGPVSVFNGAASFCVRKPLKGVTVTVAFVGVTEVGGKYVNFLSEGLEVFSGGEFGGTRGGHWDGLE